MVRSQHQDRVNHPVWPHTHRGHHHHAGLLLSNMSHHPSVLQMLTQAECQQVLQNHVAAANAAFNKVAVFESLIQQKPHNTLYYKEVQRVQKNQHIHVAIKLQHILEADDQFRCSAGLPRLDLLEHLWGVHDMWSAHSREQDFMAITAEIEILCQQLKLKGMYSVPSPQPSTAGVQPNHNVHFQPINPAPKSPMQPLNHGIFNPLLNLVDDSPRPPSSSSSSSIPCEQPTPQGSTQTSNSSVHTSVPHAPHAMVPPTPYVNQAAIDQHTGSQAPLLPRVAPATTVQHRQHQGPSNTQTSTLAPPATSVIQAQTGCCPQAMPEVQPPMATIPQDTLPAHLPFVPAPSAPNSTLPTLGPGAPFQMDAQPKSQNGQGVKQTPTGKQASDKVEPICWRCKQTGHLKRDCPMPPYCSKCRQEGHIPAKCPQKDKRTSVPQSLAGQPQAPMDPRFSNPNNKCLHCGGNHRSAVCPTLSQHQPTPSTSSCVSSAGKPHINMSPQQGTKNSQSTTCSMTSTLLVNNPARAPRHNTGNNIPQVSPQVNPNVPQQHNLYMPNAIPPTQIPNQFLPSPYFLIPFPLPPVTPSNVSAASLAHASDLSAAISLMTNAVNQGNSNTTAITDALQRTTTQFVDALQQTIQMGVDAQAEEIKNARLGKQFDKIKIFDGSDPSACHPWLEEIHALCTQTGRSFREMLLLSQD